MKFGTHNLHDTTGKATPFADVIIFTEAIPALVKEQLPPDYRVVVCRSQKDLIIAYRKNSGFKRALRRPRYHKIVDGVAKVTPNRGTFWVYGKLNGKKCVVIAEHRINAAFPPYIRGEDRFRKAMWIKHTAFTTRLIDRLKAAGKIVLAGGDLNTPRGVKGYTGSLTEVGDHFDRLGVHGVKARSPKVLSKEGSDHNRLVVEIF